MTWNRKPHPAGPKPPILPWGVALALLAGCGADFDPGSLLQDLRVLGVQTRVVGDDTRAVPLPGETLQATTLAFGPDRDASFTWAMSACLTFGSPFGGLAPCEGAPLAFAAQNSRTSDLPTLSIPVPADALSRSRLMQVVGVVCPEGMPDPATLSGATASLGENLCVDPAAPGEPFLLNVAFDDGQGNRIPDVERLTFRVDEAPWPLGEEGVSACARSEALRLRRSDAATVTLHVEGFDPADLESFTFLSTEPMEEIQDQERLQLSHFTTAGELERQFSTVENEEDLAQEVDWDLPPDETLPTAGLSVRFIFVLRDGRGGVSQSERSLCVTP